MKDVATALSHAREFSHEDDFILGCGSLYLVAEMRAIVLRVADRHH
jgi:folylpolyglutamate synthase/dihydropteroate synthase